MRLNVYHEELTNEGGDRLDGEPRLGVRYCGLRIFQVTRPRRRGR